MAFNFSPKVVTDGLVLYLDAANSKSIVSGSTTWNDLSRSQNNGNLVNGPTFDSGNGGSIVFDGTNDYYSASTSYIQSSHTIISWVYINSLNKNWIPILEFQFENAYRAHYYVQGDLNPYTDKRRGFGANWHNGSVNAETWNAPNLLSIEANRWYMFTGVLNGNLGDTYVNTEKSKSTITVPSYTNIQITNVLNARPLEGYYNSGFVSSTLIYNRALTPQEVLQNYNATKRRFGL
jgi:hypothetical protein